MVSIGRHTKGYHIVCGVSRCPKKNGSILVAMKIYHIVSSRKLYTLTFTNENVLSSLASLALNGPGGRSDWTIFDGPSPEGIGSSSIQDYHQLYILPER